jgi:hypothetical protein
MRSLIKLLLLVLLMVAIPIQGFAAVSVRLCDAHATLSSHAHDASTIDASHCEHHHAGDDVKSVKQKPAQDGHGKCGGNCCALGALAAMALSTDAIHLKHPEQGVFRSAFFYSLTLSPPQRPPLFTAA